MINFQFFPRSHGVTPEIQAVIDCFKKIETTLDDGKHRVSNDVLALLRPYLEACGATTRDYREVKTFLETLYVSNRLRLPLKGILLIGY